MSRKRHIDTRNLIVCETFDDFSEKVRHLDENVEDVVGYVTSISRVLYWNNLESVWGVLGFSWDTQEPMLDMPFQEERLEHVEASGAIIDYDNKPADWKLAHAVTKGYGHFNLTTVPFTIIPKLPDGYRITEFNNTFQNIASDEIELQNSDWSKLNKLTNLVPLNKDLNLDLTGADIRLVEGTLFDGNTSNMTSKLYIKCDFSKVDSIKLRYGWSLYPYKNEKPQLIVDDNNKYINLPIIYNNINSAITLYWKGEGPFDLRYFFKEIYNHPTTVDGAPLLYSENGRYNITVSTDNTYMYIAARDREINTQPASEEEAIDVTIDTSLNTNILLSRYFSFVRDSDKYLYKALPIKYKGSISSIDWYNPCMYIDEYPTYNSDIVSKILDNEDGKIMPYPFFYSLIPCPYTIDASTKKYLNIFEGLRPANSFDVETVDYDYLIDLTPSQSSNKKYAFDILPDLITNDEYDKVVLPINTLYGYTYSPTWVVYKCPSIKSKYINIANFYIGENTSITTAYFNCGSGVICAFYNSNYPHIKLYANEGNICINWNPYMMHFVNHTDMNYVQFMDITPNAQGEIGSADKEKLKVQNVNVGGCTACSIPADGYSYLQPWVVTNENPAYNYRGRVNINWNDNKLAFNPSFIFIYRASIAFNNNALNVFTNEVVKRVIYHIEPLNDPNDYAKYDVSIHSAIYNRFTVAEQAEITAYIASIHYTKTITNA